MGGRAREQGGRERGAPRALARALARAVALRAQVGPHAPRAALALGTVAAIARLRVGTETCQLCPGPKPRRIGPLLARAGTVRWRVLPRALPAREVGGRALRLAAAWHEVESPLVDVGLALVDAALRPEARVASLVAGVGGALPTAGASVKLVPTARLARRRERRGQRRRRRVRGQRRGPARRVPG